MWEERHAEDLQQGDTFHFADESPALAHVVSTPVSDHLDAWVRFCTHLKVSDRAEGPSVVEANTTVYVLT